MSRILIINCTILTAAVLLGLLSVTQPANVDDSRLVENRQWQLDAETAKTIAQEASERDIVLKRKKRWRRRFRVRIRSVRRFVSRVIRFIDPSIEENREEAVKLADCQARCWSAWSAPGPCSVQCGNGGSRLRTRTTVRTDCSCPGLTTLRESCSRDCSNGGTPRLNDCACPAEYTGTCCGSRVKCGNPGFPAHGSVSPAGNTHYYNTEVTYSCNPGWQISGGTSPRKCQSSEHWSGSMPSCTRVPCPHPGTPQDGSVAPTTGFLYETLVQFSCNPGFNLSGSETSKCQNNRQWSHSPPDCNRISCGDPGQIPDGTVTGNNYKFRDVIQYSCDSGFTLIGSSERECQADGTWSCDSPRCTSSVSLIPKCPSLSLIDSGTYTLSDELFYRSVAEYSCDEGFFLNGNSRLACQADQQWSDSEPTCVRITCQRLNAPANGQVTQPSGSPEHGSQATFSCDSGYRLDGDAQATCGGSEAVGSWSAAIPVCQAVDCGAPIRPKNGKITGTDFTFMHSVDVQCGPGFYLEGSAQLTCNENGEWVGEQESPSCVECSLDHYNTEESSATNCTSCPDHSHTASTASNNLLQCTCDTGYEGPSGGPCTIIRCPELVTPENGHIAACDNVYQSVCDLTCNSGYIVNAGSLSRECQLEGAWSGEPLKCAACPKDTYQESTYFCQRCPDNAMTSRNASLITDCICSTGFQSEAPGQNCSDVDECAGDHPCQQQCTNTLGSYRCNCASGYSLDGLPDQNPTNCVKKLGTCPADDLIAPINGGLVCGVVNVYEEYCSPYCNPGHEILGHADEYITCKSATQWKWSHTLTGTELPICTAVIFEMPFFEGAISYFEADCDQMTEEQMTEAEQMFVKKLEDNGVCQMEPGGNCEVETAEVKCGEVFEDPLLGFSRKKRQALPEYNTLFIRFTFNINVGSTACTEVDCQKKYDKLVEIEQQRIRDELHLATQPFTDKPGCPLCIADADGNVLSMNTTGGVRVPCPDGTQQSGFTCRRCQSGTYHNTQSGNCELCPAGQYQPEAGKTECLSCPYLESLDKRGATKCPVSPEETYNCQTNNPCLDWNNEDYKMYYSHTNAGKFIQCTGHQGGCYEMPCPATLIWNPNDNHCVPVSLIPLTDIY